MNILIWLLVGGIVGWIANMALHTEAEQGFLVNIAVGVAGALLGGWLITPLIGTEPADGSLQSPLSILLSLVGAIVLLAFAHLLQRKMPR
ncbi:Transglycosylase associated protein [Delftia tsuruhatensis]|nr:Transglycosylase associated protein [Delftia tsuruhatensis]CAC9682041.1 Transglycosylase associated protein [Delftia tsuruhatensis]